MESIPGRGNHQESFDTNGDEIMKPIFDFKTYQDKISNHNALKCLNLYLEQTNAKDGLR